MFLLYPIFLIVFIVISLYFSGDVLAFLDIPSFLFIFFLVFGVLLSKYGKDLFKKKSVKEKREFSKVAIFVSVLSGTLGTVMGFVIMLGNLSDAAAIGPATAVSLLTFFYGVIVALFFIPGLYATEDRKVGL